MNKYPGGDLGDFDQCCLFFHEGSSDSVAMACWGYNGGEPDILQQTQRASNAVIGAWSRPGDGTVEP